MPSSLVSIAAFFHTSTVQRALFFPVFSLSAVGVPPRNTARLVVRSGFTTAFRETVMENPPTHFEHEEAALCLRRTDRKRIILFFRYLPLCY